VRAKRTTILSLFVRYFKDEHRKGPGEFPDLIKYLDADGG